MAPGLSGRQTGTVPKNKPRSNGSQSHRQSREQHIQSSSVDWEPMSVIGNKKLTCTKNCTLSEAEADSVQSDLERTRLLAMTSQNENVENYPQNSLSGKLKLSDHKQVISILSQIQRYLQQTADLMNAIKSSDSPCNEVEESKRMQKFSKIVSENYGPIMCIPDGSHNNVVTDEEELARKSEESLKRLEALQKRKQELLKLQEKAKRQLEEAQAEQSRLVARASSLNQELSSTKMMDINVQQLNQRLKAVQQMYNTRNQISESLNESRKINREEHVDEEPVQEMSDTETDFQLVADKMEELNAMNVQLNEIQKIMTSINGSNNAESTSRSRGSNDDSKDHSNHNFENSLATEVEPSGCERNSNLIKLEQAKSKLNHLTQLLDIVQTAQNTSGLSPPYLQLVNNLVNDGAGSSTPSPSPTDSAVSPQKNRDEISIETMQVMTRELEETTAAMKEERDKLEAARQELQNIARRLPLNKSMGTSLSPNNDSESEPPCLKPASLDSSFRDVLNGTDSVEAEQSSNCNDGSIFMNKRLPARNSAQQESWNASMSASNFSTHDRHSKNESLSRSSNLSFRGGSRNLVRDSRWSPAPSISNNIERPSPAVQIQNQLEMSGHLCEMALSESGIHPGEITLQEMFNQHQLLTRTVAQCSQLLWLQQKQIIELRNALMLHQSGAFSNFNIHQMLPNQFQSNVPLINNSPYLGFPHGTNFSNANQFVSVPIHHNHHHHQQQQQQHQNCQTLNQNTKLNSREIQNVSISNQEFPTEQFSHQSNSAGMNFSFPDMLNYDLRYGNYNRLNLPMSNTNHNLNQNVCSASNTAVHNGLNCLGPEDSGALNNQVPPGNRANNYWDNFRSYSRQNLLSHTKSNEDTETSRRAFLSSSQDRPPRDLPPPSQNNQSGAGALAQPAVGHGNSYSSSPHQILLPPSLNTQVNHHVQISRARLTDAPSHRNPAKNETRHQDNDSRTLILPHKNEASGLSRTGNSDSGSENIRSVRNDVNHSLQNTDNLNSSRNYSQSSRDHGNEDVAQGINKKGPERIRCRKEVLNNRGYGNTRPWENISSEVSNFTRTNEVRPDFLVQLFRELQHVNTDNLRQRTLESIQETVSANNLSERTTNTNGVNVNLIENRNNIRGNRSNLNRNQSEGPGGIDQLFCQLREIQNTIRQDVATRAFALGENNLENPNISNVRDLAHSRNNLENEGLRDLRMYFEANLCNFGGNHSTLENPNLSNIRENLTRRGPGTSDYENVNPKNVDLSIYDNAAVELRRSNLDSSAMSDGESQFRNFEVSNAYTGSNYLVGNQFLRTSNNLYELGSFEEAVGGQGHFLQESGSSNSRFQVLEGGDNFSNSRPFLPNGNDSGIDINFNNEERKRSLGEGEAAAGNSSAKPEKNAEGISGDATSNSLSLPQWQRNGGRENSFQSPSFISICDNSLFNCRSFQQSDNGDLAEADQSRNEETSGAESDNGFLNSQTIQQETGFAANQSHQSCESNLSRQNVPESERNFAESRNCPNGVEEGASVVEGNSGFANSTSEPEGNFSRANDNVENFRKSETPEGFFYQLNAASSSEERPSKSTTKYFKEEEESEKETAEGKASGSKNLGIKCSENSFKEFSGANVGEYENQNSANSNHSGMSLVEERQEYYPITRVNSGTLRFPIGRYASQESGSDWECESELDEVPMRLKKSGSSRKSDDSGECIF